MYTKRELFKSFKNAGMSVAGAVGMLANADFSALDSEIVHEIDCRRMKRPAFVEDTCPFGLYHWMGSLRKGKLWAFWRECGGSIGDAQMQADFAVMELMSAYPTLFADLCQTEDAEEAAKKILLTYTCSSAPLCLPVKTAAVKLMEEIKAGEKREAKADPAERIAFAPQWPPLPVLSGDTGAAVSTAQALLHARGYYAREISGEYDGRTQDAVEAFQMAKGLPITGQIDGGTWRRLLSLEA